MLFGDEFDADERAEVGGCDGRVIETEERDVSSDLRHLVLTARKQGGKHVFPVWGKEGRDFVGYHVY